MSGFKIWISRPNFQFVRAVAAAVPSSESSGFWASEAFFAGGRIAKEEMQFIT